MLLAINKLFTSQLAYVAKKLRERLVPNMDAGAYE